MTPTPPDTVWIYWEGPTPPYIELCARTIAAHHHNVRRLDAPAFEALRETDADIDLTRLKLNHKADYIRAYLLQRYGGLWLDIDCVVFSPLAPILDALRVCDYIGYREAQAQDPQLGLMASSAGGRIITRHYNKVAAFLRSRKEPEWLDVSSWPMNKALAEESWQGYLQLDRRRVVPISWIDNDRFFIERDDAEHARVCDETALCYMLYNVMIPPWFKALSAEDILCGRTFLSYLFRRALGPSDKIPVAPLQAFENELFEMKSWTTGYGIVGLGPRRGFSFEGSDCIDASRVDFDLAPYTTLSAHASSEVTIATKVPVAVRGFTDSAASDLPSSPIRFEVDGRPLGSLHAGGRRTQEVAVTTPGLHTLRAICDGDLTRRYSVWAVRPYRPEGLRIVMPTSNRYVDVARASLELLDRYWPDHPPVDVIRHEREVAAPGAVRQHYAGPQADVTWTEAMAGYLEQQNPDELFLLMLDDYAMCAPVKQAGVDAALSVMRDDPSVATYLLTWMGAPEKRPYPGREDTILFSRWVYTVNLQAGIWRRSSFLRILKACGMKANIDTVEIAGTKYFNEREFETEKVAGANVAEPANPSLFLDGVEKDGWVLPYHNLVHRGVLDGRHAAFWQKEGIWVSLPTEGR